MGILLPFCLFAYLCICDGHVTHQRASHFIHADAKTNNLQPISTIKVKPHKDICKSGLFCVPYVQCPAHVRITDSKKCKTLTGRNGVCCNSGQNHSEAFTAKFRGHHHLVKIDPATLKLVARHSRAEMVDLDARETRLLAHSHSTMLFPGSASYGHFRNSRLHNMADLTDVMVVASRALEIAIATRAFKDRQGLTNDQLELGMIQQDLKATPLGGVCPPPPLCPEFPQKYSRIDGNCNNGRHPSWGGPMTPYTRLLPPSYQDGVWSPRVSEAHGEPLPSPRLISITMFSEEDHPEPDYTLMVMQFGQFFSHDITQSLDTSFGNGSAISCCSPDGAEHLPPQFRHYACMPISIPESDNFYGTFKQGCMNFVRSVLAPNHDCTLGYAQQMNKVTHFIDASSIYGSSPEQLADLRSFESGKLNVFNDFGRDLLPLAKDSDACLTMEQGSACFTSGDTRTNQMASLVVLHTVFMREHNRIAGELQKINPHWNDERTFLETRRIIIAELQVIIYKEFLPAVIGDIAMEEFQLNLGKEGGYAYDYDPSINPSITNEFATAALRFGHSTVDGLMKVYGPKRMEEVIAIPEIMFQPARLRKRHFLDELLSSLTTEPMQKVDGHIADALTKYMFRAGNPFGIDLAALNIQRGRDHGLRPYNDYRALIGLPKFKNFEEFGPKIGEKLRKVYATVDDVDLWVGGLLEDTVPGSVVGYTFRDIIADQFYRLKKGDRYFFENNPDINPSAFTPDQLFELRKASMSRIVCDNSDGILLARQAPNAFRKPGGQGNKFADCSGPEIPRIDLIPWQQ